MPYVTEISVLAAGFIASYVYAEPLRRRLGGGRRAATIGRVAAAAVRRLRRFLPQ